MRTLDRVIAARAFLGDINLDGDEIEAHVQLRILHGELRSIEREPMDWLSRWRLRRTIRDVEKLAKDLNLVPFP